MSRRAKEDVKAACSDVDGFSFHLAERMTCIYGTFLKWYLDDADFNSLSSENLLRELHRPPCFAGHELMETGVIKVVGNANHLAASPFDLPHTDQYVSRRVASAVGESEDILEQLTFISVARLYETVLPFLEIQEVKSKKWPSG